MQTCVLKSPQDRAEEGFTGEWEGGREGTASCLSLSKSLNLSGPLALCLAMPAAPPSHPSDHSVCVTSAERPSLTANNQLRPSDVYVLSVIKYPSGLLGDQSHLGPASFPSSSHAIFLVG